MIEDKKLQKFYIGLSMRKREVIELASRGMSNEEIAKSLSIAASSVAENLTPVYSAMANMEEFEHLKPNRLILISVFAPFFGRHPDLCNDHLSH